MRHRTAAGSARLFIAAWPGAGVRSALAVATGRWTADARAAPVPADRLHLTLHFLGDVARERMPALRAALALPFAPFTLTLSRPARWSGGIAVLEPARIPPAMAHLHAALGAALQGQGLAPDGRPWRPHVTLARRAAAATLPARWAAPRWRVGGYALVESSPATGYAVLQRYAASAPAPLERGQRSGVGAGVQ